MSELRSATEIAREDLLPRVETLCRLAREHGAADQEAFFEHVRRGLDCVREADDLAGPFMELSTSAFRGFAFSFEVSLLLDEVLAIAQSLSMTLSAPSEAAH